jgi:hypothetical protein
LQIENEHVCLGDYPISTSLDRCGTAPRRLPIMAHQRSVSALPNFLILAVCVLLAPGVMCTSAYAQGVSFAGVQTTVGSGLSFPFAMAVDGAGNVFIADSGNSRVVEVPAG